MQIQLGKVRPKNPAALNQKPRRALNQNYIPVKPNIHVFLNHRLSLNMSKHN